MSQSPAPSEPRPEDAAKPAEDARSAADKRRGVQQQRQHIIDLTGEDPLRGGVAD